MTEGRTIIGIDLGTTFSLVSVFQAGVPVVLPNSLGECLTPSAVAVDEDGSVLVGAAARAMAVTHPDRVVMSFKRDMGTNRTYEIAGHSFTPQMLSAMVLESLRKDAEASLGIKIDEAIITVPAYFGDAQRQATRDAASLAGIKAERIVNEPTAAALAYGLHQRGSEARVAVLDLGGGTFDVTVLEIIEGVIEIQSSAGDTRLGGDDFDQILADLAEKRLQRMGHVLGENPIARARLREAAQLTKKQLSSSAEVKLVLSSFPLKDGLHNLELTITQEDAEKAWAPLLEKLRLPIRRALGDAGLKPDQIDQVLLVGGSTRMPCVARVAAEMFGRLPLRALPPDEAVAMGAAVQAALKACDQAVEDLVVTDVAPFTLGVSTAVIYGGTQVSGVFAPIIERGTVIPCSRVKDFYTIDDNQNHIRVAVYQGEHSSCSDNTLLGEYVVKNIPRGPKGMQRVDIRFSYDLNGILEVDTTVMSTGKTESLVIEKSPGRLSSEQIRQARKALSALKFHPRDSLPNRTALARADALFVELSGDAREALGAVIAELRLALERQNSAEIEQLRGRLIAVTSALRSSKK